MSVLSRIRGKAPSNSGIAQNYTPEQLAAQTNLNWSASGYKAEQTASDIGKARNLWQNYGYASEAVNLLSNSIIGKTGIVVSFEHEENRAHWDAAWWNPLNRDEPFKEQQRRIMQNLAIDGESFPRYHFHQDSLFIEHIDPLNIPHDNAETLGINRDSMGRPVSYQLRVKKSEIINVPASQMAHIFWGRFTATRRGMSMLQGAIQPLQDLRLVQRDYQGAVRVLLAFRALVKYSQSAPDIPKLANGNVDLNRLARMISIGPDKMPLIPDGLEFIQPEQSKVEPDLFLSLKKALLSEAARAIGVSYFSLASDLEGANFSSLRQGAIADKDLFYWLLSILLSFVARSVREWIRYMVLQPGVNTQLLLADEPSFFLPEFEFIDPAKEAAATGLMHGINGIALSEIIRKDNRDPDETFRLLAEDKKRIQDYEAQYGVTPDEDAMADGAGNAERFAKFADAIAAFGSTPS